jgi:hypothetical protein
MPKAQQARYAAQKKRRRKCNPQYDYGAECAGSIFAPDLGSWPFRAQNASPDLERRQKCEENSETKVSPRIRYPG